MTNQTKKAVSDCIGYTVRRVMPDGKHGRELISNANGDKIMTKDEANTLVMTLMILEPTNTYIIT